jgi:hypothetical protein
MLHSGQGMEAAMEIIPKGNNSSKLDSDLTRLREAQDLLSAGSITVAVSGERMTGHRERVSHEPES